MFQFFKNHDLFLYHYTTAEIAIDYILKDRRLKLGQYTNTNDPKETKAWRMSIGAPPGKSLEGYSLDDISSNVSAALKSKANVLCFTADHSLSGNHIQDIHRRGYGHPRMWAHYAGNHTGVCLIFLKSEITNIITQGFSSTHTIYHGPVTYCDRTIAVDAFNSPYTVNVYELDQLGLDEYVKRHVAIHHRWLFFEKLKDWSGENEYRWVLFGSSSQALYMDFGRSLAGIMFGADCTDATISSIRRIKGSGVNVEQLVWSNCTPWYSFRRTWP